MIGASERAVGRGIGAAQLLGVWASFCVAGRREIRNPCLSLLLSVMYEAPTDLVTCVYLGGAFFCTFSIVIIVTSCKPSACRHTAERTQAHTGLNAAPAASMSALIEDFGCCELVGSISWQLSARGRQKDEVGHPAFCACMQRRMLSSCVQCAVTARCARDHLWMGFMVVFGVYAAALCCCCFTRIPAWPPWHGVERCHGGFDIWSDAHTYLATQVCSSWTMF